MSELSKFSSQTRVAIYNRVSTEKKVQMEALDVQVAYTRKLVEDNHLTDRWNQYIEPETWHGGGASSGISADDSGH